MSQEVESQPFEIPTDYAGKKNMILLLLLGYSFLYGIAAWFVPEEKTAIDILLIVPFIVLEFLWCKIDAEQRGFQIGKLTRLLIIFFSSIGLILYLIQTRGFGAVISITLALLFACLMYGLMLLGTYAAYPFMVSQ